MGINADTGLLEWKPTANQVGKYTVAITASDGHGGETAQLFDISVLATAPPNDPPVINSSGRQTIALGQSYLYAVQASDSNEDLLTYSLDTAPVGMTIDSSGRITWQPQSNQIGSNSVTLKVGDGLGGMITQSFDIDVVSTTTTTRINNPPSITSTPLLITTINKQYQYNLTATDLDNDSLVWGLDKAPDGMVIDPESGTLLWNPTRFQLGDNEVRVRVMDNLGGLNTQTFTLRVQSVNTPPQINSTPITGASVGKTYTYAVIASDVEGDSLTYSITNASTGMNINASTGVVTWTPTANQLGNQDITITVDDGFGGIATQKYTVQVTATAPNSSPSITSTPVYLGAVGSIYNYQVQATDPDAADTLTYQLLSAPTGMTVDSATGLLTWANPVAGSYNVVVGAVDNHGQGAAQGFTLTTRANNAPVIQSNPKLTATPSSIYAYDVIATDADGDRLTYSLDQTSRDLGMSLDTLGRLRWTPTTGNVGSHTVVITVNDANGANQQQQYNLSVAADVEAPKVRLIANYDLVNLGESITFQARATDNTKVAGLQLLINNTPVVLDSNGMATFKPTTAGTIIAKAIATDSAGNVGQATFDVAVIDTSDVSAPDVSLDLGAYAGGTVTGAVDIKGTVSDDNLDYYRLLVAPIGSSDFREIFRGTSTVNDGVLGKFDPSLLENDSYTLRLEAHDKGGNVSFVEDTVNVSGELKLGNFRREQCDFVRSDFYSQLQT